jgi:hypothetical protein
MKMWNGEGFERNGGGGVGDGLKGATPTLQCNFDKFLWQDVKPVIGDNMGKLFKGVTNNGT